MLAKRLGLAAALCSLMLLTGAVTPNSIVAPQTPTLGLQRFVQGTDVALTYKTVYTGGTNGSICKSLIAASDDASLTHLLSVQVSRSATAYRTTASTIATSAGTASGTPPLNLMNQGIWPGLPIDSDGNPFLYLQSSDLLQVTFATALTASAIITVIAVCADF